LRVPSRHYNRSPACERVPNLAARTNPIRRTKNWHSSVESGAIFILRILWAANRHGHPPFEIGFFIIAQSVEFRFAFSVMSVSFPFAWHCFGRKPCALHHSLLLLSRLRPKNFFSTLSLRSLRPSVKFSGSPQECIRFGIWEHAPLAIPCPSKRAQKGHFTYELQSAYSRWFYWTR